MKYWFKRWWIFLSVLFILCGCSHSRSDFSAASPSAEEQTASPSITTSEPMEHQHPQIWEILHQFNWMGDDGLSDNSFANKPFLKQNSEGSHAAAGVCDINQDGNAEFWLSVVHPPRGIPSMEVFTINAGQLESMGGFFLSPEQTLLSYYKDEQGNLLLLQNVESHYGGITKLLVETVVESFRGMPIAWMRSDYDENPQNKQYYISTTEWDLPLTLDNMYIGYEQSEYSMEVTKDQYDQRIASYMASLNKVIDIAYEPIIFYHLYNGYDLMNEVRFNEISQSLKQDPNQDFQTPEEMKKTSDLVADALYQSYMQYID